MSIKAKKAVEAFVGRNTEGRLNCAQSVASAFLGEGCVSGQVFTELKNCGFGQAPDGCCGSAYAAISILKKISNVKVERFKNEFIAYTETLKCKEIRSARKIKCFQTVHKAAEILEAILKEKT